MNWAIARSPLWAEGKGGEIALSQMRMRINLFPLKEMLRFEGRADD